MIDRIKRTIQQNIDVKRSLPSGDLPHILQGMAENIKGHFQDGGKLLVCGNGGSASDATHFTAELTVRYKTERPSLPAIALGTNFSHTTAAGNDLGFEQIFAREIQGLGTKKDVLLVLSTSGNSENIIEAVKAARHLQMDILGMTGMDGGTLAPMCDLVVKIPSDVVARIQEAHILCLHILTELIEEKMFPNLN